MSLASTQTKFSKGGLWAAFVLVALFLGVTMNGDDAFALNAFALQDAAQADAQDAEQKKSVYRDDFDRELTLDWEIIRENEKNSSLKDYPGELLIVTERGSIWEDQDNDVNAPGGRVKNLYVFENKFEEDGDWQITTRLNGFQPIAASHQAGLIIYEDDENYLKFCVQYSARSGLTLAFNRETNAVAEINHDRLNAAPEVVWLRVARRGDKYVAMLSTSGGEFQEIRTLAWNGKPKKVGLIAKNGGYINAPSIEARFDYFELKQIGEEADN